MEVRVYSEYWYFGRETVVQKGVNIGTRVRKGERVNMGTGGKAGFSEVILMYSNSPQPPLSGIGSLIPVLVKVHYVLEIQSYLYISKAYNKI